MRRFLNFFVGLFIFLVAGVFVAPRFVDWNNYKTAISQQVEKMTGRELAINGNIRIAILPAPAFVVEDLSFANPSGADNPHMATLKSAEVRIALGPLLTGRIQVETIKLIEPIIYLEHTKIGSPNWKFKLTQGLSNSPSAEVPKQLTKENSNGLLTITLEKLIIENATLIYRDPDSGINERIEELSAQVAAASLQGPMETNGNATIRGTPISFNISIGEIIHGRTVPVSLRAKSSAARASVHIRGALLGLGKATKFKGNLKFEGEDLSSVLSSSKLSIRSPLLATTFQFGGKITATADEVQIEKLEFRLGKTRGFGDLTFEFADKLAANIRLDIKKLDLNEVFEMRTGGALMGKEPLQIVSRERAKVPGVISTPILFDLPKTLDVSAIISVDTISFRNDVVRDAVFNARLSDGSLRVSQVSAQFPGGSDVAVSVIVQTKNKVPNFTAEIESTVSDFRGILSWLDLAIPSIPADRLRKMSLRAQLQGTLEQIKIHNIDLYFDSSRLTGGVTFAFRERLGIGANLTLDRLNIDSYVKSYGGELAKNLNEGGEKTQTKVNWRGGKTTPLDVFTMLSRLDANIKFQAKSLIYKSKPIRNVAMDATLLRGDADIRRLSVGKFGSASISLNGNVLSLVGLPIFENFNFKATVPDPARFARTIGIPPSAVVRAIGKVKVRGRLDGNFLRPKIDLLTQVADGKVNIKGQLSSLSTADILTGRLSLENTDIAALLRRFGISYRPATSLGGMTINTNFQASLRRLSFQNFEVELGKLNMRGQGTIDLESRPLIRASFRSGPIIVDDYLNVTYRSNRKILRSEPKNSRTKQKSYTRNVHSRFSKKDIDLSLLSAIDANVDFKAPILAYGKLLIENPDLVMHIKNNKLSVSKFLGKMFEGDLKASFEATTGSSNLYALRGSIDKVNIEKYLAVKKLKKSPQPYGRMKIDIDLSSNGRSTHEIVSRLGGVGSFALTDLSINHLKKSSMVGRLLEPLAIVSTQKGVMPKNTAKITGNFHVAGGIAQSRDVKFDSNLGNGVASGNINLPEWSINLDGKLKLGQSFIRDLLKSNNQEKNLTIPFAITGNLDAPSVKMDANTFFRTGIPILGVDKILNRAPKEVEGLLKDILEKGENTLRSDGNSMQELPPAVSSEVP